MTERRTPPAFYEGIELKPGSVARQLYDDGKHKELARHMKELELKERRLRGEA